MDSALLWDYERMDFHSELAKRIGLEEAILLTHIHGRLRDCRRFRSNNRFYGGHWWYETTPEVLETETFPFWSYRRIDLTLMSLETRGLIKRREDNSGKQFFTVIGEYAIAPPDEENAGEHAIEHKKPKKAGYVYLMKSTAKGRFKIGFSQDANKRLKDLGKQSPYPIELVTHYHCDDMAGVEAYWHERFKAVRVHGEWFELNDEQVNEFLLAAQESA